MAKNAKQVSLRAIFVPRAHDPSGLWQGSRALAGPYFLGMLRVFVSNSEPIRFARFDRKSVNRRPEGSWTLGMRMACERDSEHDLEQPRS